MDSDRKKPESETESGSTPTFDEVVRKMLNTPPKPKKGKPRQHRGVEQDNGSEGADGGAA